MGEWDDPGLTKFGRQGVQLFPGRGIGRADLVEGSPRGPDHVSSVNVRRHTDPVPLDLGEVLHRLRQGRTPALRPGQLVHIAKHPFVGPVDDILPQDQHGGRRVAAGDAGLQRGLGLVAAAARNGCVGPGDALGDHLVADSPQGCGFATGGPEVHDLDRGVGEGGACGGKQQRGYGQGLHSVVPSCRSPEFRCKAGHGLNMTVGRLPPPGGLLAYPFTDPAMRPRTK